MTVATREIPVEQILTKYYIQKGIMTTDDDSVERGNDREAKRLIIIFTSILANEGEKQCHVDEISEECTVWQQNTVPAQAPTQQCTRTTGI